MTTKYTPGPYAKKGTLIVSARSIVGSCPRKVDGIDCGTTHNEREANANLFASAPELLEAMKTIYKLFQSGKGKAYLAKSDYKYLGELIAQAEGRE